MRVWYKNEFCSVFQWSSRPCGFENTEAHGSPPWDEGEEVPSDHAIAAAGRCESMHSPSQQSDPVETHLLQRPVHAKSCVFQVKCHGSCKESAAKGDLKGGMKRLTVTSQKGRFAERKTCKRSEKRKTPTLFILSQSRQMQGACNPACLHLEREAPSAGGTTPSDARRGSKGRGLAHSLDRGSVTGSRCPLHKSTFWVVDLLVNSNHILIMT